MIWPSLATATVVTTTTTYPLLVYVATGYTAALGQQFELGTKDEQEVHWFTGGVVVVQQFELGMKDEQKVHWFTGGSVVVQQFAPAVKVAQ